MVIVEIRPARQPDLNRILALYAELDMPGDKPCDPATAEKLFARIQQYPDYTLYVAVSEGSIVGAFSLLIMDNLAHRGAPSGIVEDVVVAPHFQRQGVGRQMMYFAMGKCRQANCYKLMLSSNLKRSAAHRFYDSLGFQRHGYSFVVTSNDSLPDGKEPTPSSNQARTATSHAEVGSSLDESGARNHVLQSDD